MRLKRNFGLMLALVLVVSQSLLPLAYAQPNQASTNLAYVWGDNTKGFFGNGAADYNLHTAPALSNNLADMTSIKFGFNHALALKADGTVWAWGTNPAGQLGNGTTNDNFTPTQVSGLAGVIAVAPGYYHSLALKQDGTVWAWGSAIDLGNGTSTDSYTPVQVNSLSNITAIAAGNDISWALRNDGTVWAWGYNNNGVLGNSKFSNPLPEQIAGLSGVTAIAVAIFHGLALLGDGTVVGLGQNTFGNLGNGNIDNSEHSSPVQAGVNGITAISAAGYQSYALKSDGTIWAWGRGTSGELGNGANNNSGTPVQVLNLINVTALAAGLDHTLALKQDGTVWAWGFNQDGELGYSGADSNVPVQVAGLAGISLIAAGWNTSFALQVSVPSDPGPTVTCSSAGAHTGASKVFLKLDGISGNSADPQHLNEIEVSAYEQGLEQIATGGSGSGDGAGKASFSNIRIRKTVDKATVKLKLATATGQHLKSAVFCFRKGAAEYYQVTLTDVQVVSVKPVTATADQGPLSQEVLDASTSGDGWLEEVAFSYSKIQWVYTAATGQQTSGSFDLK